MPFDDPQTPQSPSQTSSAAIDLPSKSSISPRHIHSLPTPAHSINGSMSSLGSAHLSEAVSLDESSNKRKRDVEDQGDRELKKVHLEDSRLSIEDLHIDVGKKYLLCRTPHRKPVADLTVDLFERYALTDIAKSVARIDPNGKHASIRKTYRGIIKTQKLSGNFGVEKKEDDAPDTLTTMMLAPAEEWDAQVRGSEIERGLPDATLSSMAKALAMTRGAIPLSSWNRGVLGEVASVAPAKPMSKPISNVVKTAHPQQMLNSSSQAVKDIPRPKRNVKKRAYGDSSYEGYGEGYVDDDMHETGYSTGDGEDLNGSRKRPKKTSAGQSNYQQGPLRQSSYGPGMVGA